MVYLDSVIISPTPPTTAPFILFFSLYYFFFFAEGNREYMTKLIAESVCNILSMN